MSKAKAAYVVHIDMQHGEPCTRLKVLVEGANGAEDASRQAIESQLHTDPDWEDAYNCYEDGGAIHYSVRKMVPVDPEDLIRLRQYF